MEPMQRKVSRKKAHSLRRTVGLGAGMFGPEKPRSREKYGALVEYLKVYCGEGVPPGSVT